MMNRIFSVLLFLGLVFPRLSAQEIPEIEIRDGFELGEQSLQQIVNIPDNPRHWLVDGRFIYFLHFDERIVQKYDWREKRQVWKQPIEADYERGNLFLWKGNIWLSQRDYLLRIHDGFRYPLPAEKMNYVKARGRWIYCAQKNNSQAVKQPPWILNRFDTVTLTWSGMGKRPQEELFAATYYPVEQGVLFIWHLDGRLYWLEENRNRQVTQVDDEFMLSGTERFDTYELGDNRWMTQVVRDSAMAGDALFISYYRNRHPEEKGFRGLVLHRLDQAGTRMETRRLSFNFYTDNIMVAEGGMQAAELEGDYFLFITVDVTDIDQPTPIPAGKYIFKF